jgi:hypothetical protein
MDENFFARENSLFDAGRESILENRNGSVTQNYERNFDKDMSVRIYIYILVSINYMNIQI